MCLPGKANFNSEVMTLTTLKETLAGQGGSKGHGDLDHDFCLQGHLLVRRNIPIKFEGPSPKHC